ncbi:serine aminopeptidase domain-containing protein [Pseudobacteriovorax antillogorgiicola]|uniref:Serine aminopeptidase S33 domain-containing protein n=1 Tax=Pseudobacteriovorax antillogorgiicola TaxID=1513793 RepID=A0A1Y6BIF8_9BACT|nr:alpha/beta hydrolase [Pseudobacteriovorax antillogorgiicola]TCS55383.1 hypothetical protein EDD56_105104 [Pseudobacteriovorax antillogorgiicola]SMF13213.1 hypothetical protein SAMN06296036_105220 [Pseudobacteriovorax antillogorgiicola]
MQRLQMEYLDCNTQSLFTIIEKPATKAKGMILLVNPAPHEQNRVAFFYRQMSLYMSRLGWLVCRFDFSGTGDSSGSLETRSWTDWSQELSEILRYINDRYQPENLQVFGCRLGANLVLALNHMESNIDQVIAIDPLPSSEQYLKELQDIQSAMLSHPFDAPFGSSLSHDFFGFRYSDSLLREIETHSPDNRDLKPIICHSYGEGLPSSMPLDEEFLWTSYGHLKLQFLAQTILAKAAKWIEGGRS